MLIGRRSNYKDEEIMDRRGFLRLGALLPFYKKVIKELIENKAPEPIEEMTIDWRDSYAKSLTDAYYGLNDPMFAPSLTKIGGYDVVSHGYGHDWGEPDEIYWTNERRAALLECDWYPEPDIQDWT